MLARYLRWDYVTWLFYPAVLLILLPLPLGLLGIGHWLLVLVAGIVTLAISFFAIFKERRFLARWISVRPNPDDYAPGREDEYEEDFKHWKSELLSHLGSTWYEAELAHLLPEVREVERVGLRQFRAQQAAERAQQAEAAERLRIEREREAERRRQEQLRQAWRLREEEEAREAQRRWQEEAERRRVEEERRRAEEEELIRRAAEIKSEARRQRRLAEAREVVEAHESGRFSLDNAERRYPSNWDSLRNAAYARDGFTCQNCGASGNGTVLHAHHIVPLSRGGTNKLPNLTTLCDACHKAVHSA